jgi:hypothetical protein
MKNYAAIKFVASLTLLSALVFLGCEHPVVKPGSFFEKPADNSPAFPYIPSVSASDGLITVSWNAVEDAESYEVYYSNTSTVPKNPAKTAVGTNTVISGLTNKTTYYVWLKAVYSSGTGKLSAMVKATPWPSNEKPQTPGTPKVIPGFNQLAVSWDEAGGAVAYDVYLNTTTSTESAVINATVNGTTQALIPSLANEIIYYIWIRAKNGNGTSDFSVVESGTPKLPTVPPAAPGAPVVQPGSKALAVSWTAVEMAETYELWAGTSDNPATAAKRGGDISNGELSAVITGLNNGTAYHVWVKAKNIAGVSGFSPAATGTPSASAAKPEEPGKPTITLGNKQLTVQWTTVEGATAYEVWTGETDNSANAAKYGADITATSVTITGLVNNVTRYVWVKAKNDLGTSGFSPVASGTPSASTTTPAAPSAAPTVTIGSQQLTVSWTAVEGASAYEVWAGTSNNSAQATKRGNDVSSGLSAIISGLNNETTYYVWIKAKNSVGTSGFSPAANGTPSVATLIPQGKPIPSITIGNTQLALSWTAVEKASAYEVWRGTANDSSTATKYGGDVNGLSVTMSSLTNGTTYYVWIKAKNDIGDSGFSVSVSGKPIANAGTPTINIGSGQITINWVAIPGAEQYELFFGTGDNPPVSPSQTISDPATSTAITGLINGTTYHVWVKGKNSTGSGGMSAMASAKPIADMGAVTVVLGAGQLNLSWVAIAGAEQYEVYYSTSETMPGTPLRTVTTTSTTITSLANGTLYYVWVKGKNTTGSGGISAVKNGKPLAIPGTPVITAGNGELGINWTAALGADEYEVYYGIGTASTLFTTVSGTAATITGLTNGTAYSVAIKGKNPTGSGGMSAAVSGKPSAGPGLYDGGIDTSNKIGSFDGLVVISSYLSSNAVTGHNYYIVLGQDESDDPITFDYSGKIIGITIMGDVVERKIFLNTCTA